MGISRNNSTPFTRCHTDTHTHTRLYRQSIHFNRRTLKRITEVKKKTLADVATIAHVNTQTREREGPGYVARDLQTEIINLFQFIQCRQTNCQAYCDKLKMQHLSLHSKNGPLVVEDQNDKITSTPQSIKRQSKLQCVV